jgi:transposase-like protein
MSFLGAFKRTKRGTYVPYAADLRDQVVAQRKEKMSSYSELSRKYGVPASTVRLWCAKEGLVGFRGKGIKPNMEQMIGRALIQLIKEAHEKLKEES